MISGTSRAADRGPDGRADEVDLCEDLRQELAAGALQLHFQPIFDLTTGRLIHHEALARWSHPRQGAVPPSVFVPLAESTGLAGLLGRQVLQASARQAAVWTRDAGVPMSVAVNLSAAHFTAGTVVEDVGTALAEAGLPAGQLVVELTESALIADLDGTIAQLAELRAAGLRLALDDFGTGFSSLTLMRRLPVHTVKIDRSFVEHLDSDPADAALVRLVIDAAHALGLRACAEGVERAEQLVHLTAAGCDSVQGYLLGRPGPPPDRPPRAHPALPVAAHERSSGPFAELFPTVAQLVCVLTPELRVSYASASSLTLLGYRPDELLGRHLSEFLSPEQAALLHPDATRQAEATSVVREPHVQLRHRDGSYRWLRFDIRLVDGDRSGQRTHLMCTAQDVTAAVHAQQALRRSQRLLQAAFDLSPGPTTLADLNGRLVQVNQAFADCLGTTPALLVGRALHELTHPDDLTDSRRAFASLTHPTASGYRLTKRIRHATGRWITVHLTVTVTRDAHGHPEMAIGQLHPTGADPAAEHSRPGLPEQPAAPPADRILPEPRRQP